MRLACVPAGRGGGGTLVAGCLLAGRRPLPGSRALAWDPAGPGKVLLRDRSLPGNAAGARGLLFGGRRTLPGDRHELPAAVEGLERTPRYLVLRQLGLMLP